MHSGQFLLKQLFPPQEELNDVGYLRDKLVWPSKPINFVQVLHVGQNHWPCLSNKFCDDNEVELFDSYVNDFPDKSIIQQACVILCLEGRNICLHIVDTQQQVGSKDCGLFALAYATDLCGGVDPSTHTYYQSKMRNHLKECFFKMQDIPFSLQEVC